VRIWIAHDEQPRNDHLQRIQNHLAKRKEI
jgi:hypothetical protein